MSKELEALERIKNARINEHDGWYATGDLYFCNELSIIEKALKRLECIEAKQTNKDDIIDTIQALNSLQSTIKHIFTNNRCTFGYNYGYTLERIDNIFAHTKYLLGEKLND